MPGREEALGWGSGQSGAHATSLKSVADADGEPASGQCFALGHRHFLLSFKPRATQHVPHLLHHTESLECLTIIIPCYYFLSPLSGLLIKPTPEMLTENLNTENRCALQTQTGGLQALEI